MKSSSDRDVNELRADVDCLEAEVTLLRNENKALRDRRRTLEQRIQTVGTILMREEAISRKISTNQRPSNCAKLCVNLSLIYFEFLNTEL